MKIEKLLELKNSYWTITGEVDKKCFNKSVYIIPSKIWLDILIPWKKLVDGLFIETNGNYLASNSSDFQEYKIKFLKLTKEFLINLIEDYPDLNLKLDREFTQKFWEYLLDRIERHSDIHRDFIIYLFFYSLVELNNRVIEDDYEFPDIFYLQEIPDNFLNDITFMENYQKKKSKGKILDEHVYEPLKDKNNDLLAQNKNYGIIHENPFLVMEDTTDYLTPKGSPVKTRKEELSLLSWYFFFKHPSLKRPGIVRIATHYKLNKDSFYVCFREIVKIYSEMADINNANKYSLPKSPERTHELVSKVISRYGNHPKNYIAQKSAESFLELILSKFLTKKIFFYTEKQGT